jgi:hypothetical protein
VDRDELADDLVVIDDEDTRRRRAWAAPHKPPEPVTSARPRPLHDRPRSAVARPR